MFRQINYCYTFQGFFRLIICQFDKTAAKHECKYTDQIVKKVLFIFQLPLFSVSRQNYIHIQLPWRYEEHRGTREKSTRIKTLQNNRRSSECFPKAGQCISVADLVTPNLPREAINKEIMVEQFTRRRCRSPVPFKRANQYFHYSTALQKVLANAVDR